MPVPASPRLSAWRMDATMGENADGFRCRLEYWAERKSKMNRRYLFMFLLHMPKSSHFGGRAAMYEKAVILAKWRCLGSARCIEEAYVLP